MREKQTRRSGKWINMGKTCFFDQSRSTKKQLFHESFIRKKSFCCIYICFRISIKVIHLKRYLGDKIKCSYVIAGFIKLIKFLSIMQTRKNIQPTHQRLVLLWKLNRIFHLSTFTVSELDVSKKVQAIFTYKFFLC